MSICFAYLAGSKKYSYVGILGTVTFAIVALASSAEVWMAEGMMRLLDILIGVFISLLINRCFFPIYVRKELLQSISKTLDHYSVLYQDCFSLNRPFEKLENSICEIEQISIISSSFTKQIKLLAESRSWLEGRSINLDLCLCEDALPQLKIFFSACSFNI